MYAYACILICVYVYRMYVCVGGFYVCVCVYIYICHCPSKPLLRVSKVEFPRVRTKYLYLLLNPQETLTCRKHEINIQTFPSGFCAKVFLSGGCWSLCDAA